MKSKIWLVMFLFLIPLASADHNTYDPYVDLNNINWFDRGLYTNVIKFQPCIDLNEFYAYTDSNPNDNFRRNDIRKYKDRLSRDDYFRVADENKFDNIKRRDFDDVKDFSCSTKQEYDSFADENRFDRFADDDFYRLHGYHNKYIYDNYRDEYRYSRAAPKTTSWRLDGYGGVASWYR